MLRFETYNIISFKKIKSDKPSDFNWFGYNVDKGYYYLNFHLKINKPINPLYIKKIGLKVHYPFNILYNYFLKNEDINIWQNIKIPIHSIDKQQIIFIFDEYLDDLDLEFKNIQFIKYQQESQKENVIISFYENDNKDILNNNIINKDDLNNNYYINYNNIFNTVIEPLSKLYNVYTSISVFNNKKINELANYYKPFNMTIYDKNDITRLLVNNMYDINNFVNNTNINIKFITYINLDSIFNINISKFNFYINKINFLSYHIPYIDNTISNSYQFLSIPYNYLNIIIKIISDNINNSNILYLLYSKLKSEVEQQNFHFICNENYQYNKRTPMINYLSDIQEMNNNKGYLFENKYYNYINYTNNNSKMFVTDKNEYYFYKNKTTKYTPYMWIGTYLNYMKDNINEIINIKIEFSIKILKKIDIYNTQINLLKRNGEKDIFSVDHAKENTNFGLKFHDPIFYEKEWINECILDNYSKIELNTSISSKSQYILLNFDNYFDEVEFYIKDFKIIIT
jgi:hypothetical protein